MGRLASHMTLSHSAGITIASEPQSGLSVGDRQPLGRSTPMRGFGLGGVKKLGSVTPYLAMITWFSQRFHKLAISRSRLDLDHDNVSV